MNLRSVAGQQLAQFESPANRGWLADPEKYWHKRMFPNKTIAGK
jgi:hypothetical protein